MSICCMSQKYPHFSIFPSLLMISIKNQNTVPGNGSEGLHITGAQIASVSGYFLIMSVNELKNVDVPESPGEELILHQLTGPSTRACTESPHHHRPRPRCVGQMEWASTVSLIPSLLLYASYPRQNWSPLFSPAAAAPLSSLQFTISEWWMGM